MPVNASTITVHWHDENHPVYSVDFQPVKEGSESSTRLATGGGDNNVRLWRLIYKEVEGQRTIEGVDYLCTLSKHTQAVNVVRFSPKGDLLATAGDDGTILIWYLSDHIVKEFGHEDPDAKESWILKHACRSSTSEIYDLAWSPDSKKVLTGSMDNITRIYDVVTGQQIKQILEHNHYVQGVSWDPKNEFIATQSLDRAVHIYKLNETGTTEFSLQPTIYFKVSKADLPIGRLPHSPRLKLEEVKLAPLTTGNVTAMNPPISHKRKLSTSSNGSATSSINRGSASPNPMRSLSTPSSTTTSVTDKPSILLSPPRFNTPLPAIRPMEPPTYKSTMLYHNETLQSFFRRLTFSPDGSLLLTPSGIFKNSSGADEEFTNTVYIYTRSGLNRAPVAHLPGLKKPSIAIRFNPILYKLKNTADGPPKKLMKTGDGAPQDTKSGSEIATKKSFFNLPYRMVFAVATQDSVVVYDTESIRPISYISNLHYSTLTDLAWSNDGETLIISSTDGFCSSVNMTNEFERYEPPQKLED